MSSKKPAVSLSMGGRLKPVQSAQVQNVFGDEDSDEEKPQTSAEKFHSKYGNLKARDERAVKKVLEENPDIYDYDGAYDSMQERRSRVEQEKESAKVDKKPKYTEKLLQSKKKRDLENLLRDERKQQKERKAEGDEFKDKDVFVTSSYRKQLEETVKFRKELEDSDQIDEMTSVRGQQMWRENFGKKLLDERIKQRFGNDTIEKEEENTESHKRKRKQFAEEI
ncbi:Zinc finger, C3HC4 type [Aphelenchoides bicaudatus]|nr:Zinc finger, C3HC4 type [Aphelenchoides bicaudatus]